MAAGDTDKRMEKNLISNGGFEEDFSDEGWSPDGCFIDEEHHSTGQRSARLGPGESGCYYAITEGFAAGDEFILGATGWVSDEGETGIVNVEMRGEDGLIKRQGLTFTNTDAPEGKDISMTIEDGTTKLMVCLYKEGGVGGYAYFDDISFGKKKPEIKRNDNLLANPGFESGLDGWDPDGIRFESEKVRSGEGAAYIGPGEGGGYVTITGDFTGASTITISGWGCVSLEGDNALFGVDMFDNTDRSVANRIGKYQIKFSDVSEYAYKSMDFDIAEGTQMLTVFVYKEAGVGGNAYFDDLSVVVDRQEEAVPEDGRQKVIINTPPEGTEYEDAGFPDEYDHSEGDTDYYFREYKCYTNSLAEVGQAPGANYELTERLVGYSDHIRWYKREYKKLIRAMWTWNFDILEDEAKGDEFFAFLAQKNVNTIYMNTGADESGVSRVVGHPGEYERFIRRAHEMGVKVEALDGSSDWVRRENHHIPISKINEVIAYNQSVDAACRFDGIHHDNEPYTLPEWEENKADIAIAYLDLAKESAALARSAGLTYAVDIPFWYDSVTETANTSYDGQIKSLAYHIIDLVDYVGIMAYRDTALGTDGIIYHTEDEVRYAAFSDKDLVIGVETYDVPDYEANPPKVTFYQEGEEIMNREIGKVIGHYKSAYNKLSGIAAPGFKGIAIHYYDTYKDLPYGKRDSEGAVAGAAEAGAVTSAEAGVAVESASAGSVVPVATEATAATGISLQNSFTGRFVFHNVNGVINGYGYTVSPDKAVLGLTYEDGGAENYKEALEILYVGNKDGAKVYRTGFEQKIGARPVWITMTDNGKETIFAAADAQNKTIYLSQESIEVTFPEQPAGGEEIIPAPGGEECGGNTGGSSTPASGNGGGSTGGSGNNSGSTTGNSGQANGGGTPTPSNGGGSSAPAKGAALQASGAANSAANTAKAAPRRTTASTSVAAPASSVKQTSNAQGASKTAQDASSTAPDASDIADDEEPALLAQSETVELNDEKDETANIEEEAVPLVDEVSYENAGEDESESKKGGSKGPIIAILLLAAAALVGGGIFAVRRTGLK